MRHDELIEWALQAVSRSRALARRSETLIQSCALLIRFVQTRHRHIADGSGGDTTAMAHRLRWSVRRRLAYGVLPELDGRAWQGPATGKPCIICSMHIVYPDAEYEVEVTKRKFAHAWCFTMWLEETRRFRG